LVRQIGLPILCGQRSDQTELSLHFWWDERRSFKQANEIFFFDLPVTGLTFIGWLKAISGL
jgi:hypothetical protein